MSGTRHYAVHNNVNLRSFARSAYECKGYGLDAVFVILTARRALAALPVARMLSENCQLTQTTRNSAVTLHTAQKRWPLRRWASGL